MSEQDDLEKAYDRIVDNQMPTPQEWAAESELRDLESAVVEAAVKLAQTSDHIDSRSEWEANEDALLDSAKALIEAREKGQP